MLPHRWFVISLDIKLAYSFVILARKEFRSREFRGKFGVFGVQGFQLSRLTEDQ
jgi:hypothetical protein